VRECHGTLPNRFDSRTRVVEPPNVGVRIARAKAMTNSLPHEMRSRAVIGPKENVPPPHSNN
jgi:hypothetical protein